MYLKVEKSKKVFLIWPQLAPAYHLKIAFSCSFWAYNACLALIHLITFLQRAARLGLITRNYLLSKIARVRILYMQLKI